MPHFTTILAQSPKGILSALAGLHGKYRNHTLLFALSSNSSELSELVARLTTFSKHSVGCLSAQAQENTISCSLAFFDSQHATTFRSTIPGRAAPQVGRWHSFKKPDTTPDLEFDQDVDWEDVWSKSVGNHPLPQGLQGTSPHSVIYFSDDAPEGLNNSLQVLPDANKLGMIASSTPFITGRPFTLFENDKIHSSGAVGLAISDRPSRLCLEFPEGLKPITTQLTITRSEGNLVHDLDNSNATRKLLAAIETAGITNAKEDDFYLTSGDQVYHIISGDPSRGTLCLESHAAPEQGVQVQLCHLPRKTALVNVPAARGPSVQFQALTRESELGAEMLTELSDIFHASSENGFLVARAGENPWKCTVAGGIGRLRMK